MPERDVTADPEQSVHGVLAQWHAGRVPQTKPVWLCMGICYSWGYQDVLVLPLGAWPLKKENFFFVWSKLQLTKVPTCRYLKAFTYKPLPGLKHLSWKAADQILGHSPKSRGVSCPCLVVWCDRAADTGSASLPRAALLVWHGQHPPCVPALSHRNASTFLWKTSRDGKSFISVSNLSH